MVPTDAEALQSLAAFGAIFALPALACLVALIWGD